MNPILIIVTGAPGTGKTTLRNFLSEKLGIPYVAKDAIKEILFEKIGTVDKELSRKLSSASFALLFETMDVVMVNQRPLIIEANFKPYLDSQKINDLMKKHGYRSIQILCTTDAEVLRKRFIERAKSDRHPGHCDDKMSDKEIDEMITDKGNTFLDIDGERIDVDTTDFGKIDNETILKRIRDAIEN